MKRTGLTGLGAGCAALALVAWAARVEAYPMYDDGAGEGCVECHDGFKSTGPLHQDHLNTFFNTPINCTACHQSFGGQVPVLTYWSTEGYGCSGCHGMDYGQTTSSDDPLPQLGFAKSTAYGLRAKHALEFAALGQPDECVTCHFPGSPETGEPDPAPAILPETTRPPYYNRSWNNLTDPCSSEQESFESVFPGLDNDGNGFPDMTDSACGAFVTTTTITSTSTSTSSTTSTTLPGGGARRITIYPGQSIQKALDAVAPGGAVFVMPGTYVEPHGGPNAITINKNGIKLIARSKPKQGKKVILQAGPGQRNGIVVEPAAANTRIDGVKIKGFTVQGFPNNGIVTRYVDNFRIERNESIDNLENGIWPTLSANGLVKKNVAYGSQDSALWVEASENVRVIGNELYDSPTGLEITVSYNVLAKNNDVHDNTTGIGLYHPSGAGLPPLQPLERNGYWQIVDNHVYDNNAPNSAPPGSMSGSLPPGGGILVLGVDNVEVRGNLIENNTFYGIAVVDWCLAVDCGARPPVIPDTAPDDNTFVGNTLINNGNDPVDDPEFALFALLAADITYAVPGEGHPNCFAKNTYTTLKNLGVPILADSCR